MRLAGAWEAVGRCKHINMEISEATIVGHVPTATGTRSDSSEIKRGRKMKGGACPEAGISRDPFF